MTRVEAALAELQQYLQDEIPPAAASDAVAMLMAQPADVVMQRVATWSAEQNRAKALPVSDLLLHALKKIYVTGELKLLDRSAVADYLDRVTTIALRICPTEERDRLRASLTTMRLSGEVDARFQAPVTRVATITNVPVPVVVDEDAQNARRFSLILDRLKHDMEAGVAQNTEDQPQALAQLLTMAASRSQTGAQLNDYLQMIRPLTGNEKNVFVILGGAVPSWDMSAIAPTANYKPPAQVTAMEKIIDLAEDPLVAMGRFRELVTAAVTKFNDGSLAATVWMLDVAEDTIIEKKLDIAAVNQTRQDAADAINSVALRKYTENKTKHAALKIVLEFFPTLRLESVLRQLRGEARAERRRTLLGFAEAYAGRGREAAVKDLESELQRPDVDTYYLRNLIYLLHRMSRDSDDGTDRELALLTQASAPGQNVYVIKEAATAIGQIKTDASAKLLTTRLAEFEVALLRIDTTIPPGEGPKLLDRIIASLARIGTPNALLTIARHGMKANPALGDTRARLAVLSQHDLSFDEATVNVLLKALRDDIPGKLLGRFVPKKQDQTVKLIEALSGTRSESVQDVFTDIASRFADQDIGKAAAQVLEKWAPPKMPSREPVATLTGELEFFGLPSVMQSLGDMRATGMLTLRNKQGQAAAKLVVSEGKFVNAQRGSIRGDEALYDMLERPISGTFAFVPYPPERMQTDLQPREMMALLLEGVRRHDELQRILALIPDGISLVKTSVKPTPHEEESDPAFIRDIWLKASSGAKLGEWEREIPSDSYRVRRLVVHWLEQGALAASA